MKLLIIEDSIRLCRSLTAGFEQLGYIVEAIQDGAEGLKYALTYDYDAIVLDIMLPSMDGLSILKKLRDKRSKTPVLILSARDEISDRIKGLNIGADDYLCKPFSFDELNARLITLIRRCHGLQDNNLVLGNLTLDIGRREASVGDNTLALTPNEYTILEYLLMHQGKIVTYENLENHLYDSNVTVTRNAIEAHVSALRKKLKHFNCVCHIKTRRSFGYLIEVPTGLFR